MKRHYLINTCRYAQIFPLIFYLSIMFDEVIQNKYSKIWWDEGIVCVDYQTEHVDLAIAKVIVGDRIRICNSKAHPLFVDFRQVKKVEKNARHFLAHEEGAYLVNSCGILVESFASKIIGNFFMNINRPIVPFKIFTNPNLAKMWLQQYRSQ